MHEKKPTTSKGNPPQSAKSGATPGNEERQKMIAEAAYYRAQRRAFQSGDVDDDWYHAEAEIDALLGRSKTH